MGIIAAPKKRKVHNKTDKYINWNKNPIGKAKTKDTKPNAIHIFIAFITFFPLYPPYLSDIVPPTITPLKGAVILIPEKTMFTNNGSMSNISIKYFVSQNCIPVTIKYIEHNPNVIETYKGVVNTVLAWKKYLPKLLVSIESIRGSNFLLNLPLEGLLLKEMIHLIIYY